MPPKAAAKPRSPLRRLLRVVGLVAIVFIVAIGASVFFSWRAANRAPEWWRPVNPTDPQVDRAARSIENTISEQVHRARATAPAASPTPDGAAKGADTWTLTLKEAEANAWLGARLKDWLLNRNESVTWPTGASQPQVSFTDGLVTLGIELGAPEGGARRVVSAGLAPRIDEQGLWMKLETFAIGRFALPGSTVAEAGGSLLESRLPPDMKSNPDTGAFISALSGTRPLVKEAVMKLSDGRRVQILRITPRQGEVEVECRTLTR